MQYVVMVGQLMLSLSILIILHELGHFLPARWFNTRVEKFYLFFDPYFELFKKKIGDTEYGIGWLPLGGYVKISGMVDESLDMEAMAQEPQPWEFRSKPAWQRLIIMLGGVTVNFFLGIFIFAMLFLYYGEEYLPAQNAKYGIYTDSLGAKLGLREGDKVVSVGGKTFDKFNDRTVLRDIIINNASDIVVERQGQKVTLPIDGEMVKMVASQANQKDKELFGARIPFIVKEVVKDKPASKVGILAEDQIIGFNDLATPYFSDFQRQARLNKGKEITLSVLRGKDTIRIKPTLDENGLLGVGRYGADKFFDFQRQDYTFLSAFPAGASKGVGILSDQIKAFGQMFKGKIKASESLGGFATMSKMYGYEWIWERFWTMTAVISMILAFMNLLPIPALDGGYVMFLLFEVITGKKPSDKFMGHATTVGFALLMCLMLYANGMDIIRGLR